MDDGDNALIEALDSAAAEAERRAAAASPTHKGAWANVAACMALLRELAAVLPSPPWGARDLRELFSATAAANPSSQIAGESVMAALAASVRAEASHDRVRARFLQALLLLLVTDAVGQLPRVEVVQVGPHTALGVRGAGGVISVVTEQQAVAFEARGQRLSQVRTVLSSDLSALVLHDAPEELLPPEWRTEAPQAEAAT